MVHFAAHCVAGGIPFAVLDLMETVASGDWRLSVPPDPADFVTGAETVRLADLTGLYIRPIYLGRTPSDAACWHGLMEGLGAWMDEAGLTVVNRLGAHQLNGYKPAHYAWLSAHGLLVPPSLLSADPRRIREFIGGGRAVVKPVCGTRATTREIGQDDLGRLARSEGPVLVQRMIEGDDVRVHVVGDAVIACRFSSTTIDYRSDREATREVTGIPAALASLLVARTAEQGLAFAGWDFKLDRDGTYWCLECNPMPGYSFYDRVCDGAVSDALIKLLAA
jgi:glutathione synthase/RimK-type ligase-like ATP-grasp enzyme